MCTLRFGLPWWLSGERMWMWVWSLGWEDALQEGMTTHSSVLAWGIPWTEEPDGLQSVGSQRGHMTAVTKVTLPLSFA